MLLPAGHQTLMLLPAGNQTLIHSYNTPARAFEKKRPLPVGPTIVYGNHGMLPDSEKKFNSWIILTS